MILPLLMAIVGIVMLSGLHFYFYWASIRSILCWEAAGLAISLASGIAARKALPGWIAKMAVSRFDKSKA